MSPSRRSATRRDSVLVAAITAVAAAFLLYRLGEYAGTLLTWEPSVVEGFEMGLRHAVGAWRWASGTLLWDDGLLSAGHTSLFYGTPTYALFRTVGVGPATLRIAAVIAGVLSIPVAARVASRIYGARAAVPAAALVALSPPFLLYARYGTSASGMLLASWIALGASLFVLAVERPRARHGLAAAAALYVATLQYAPARLLVVYFLCFLSADLLLRRRAGRKAWGALGALLAGVVAVLAVQVACGRQGAFLHARGEQFLEMIRQADYVSDYLGRRVDPAKLTFSDRLDVATAMVRRTGPQLLDFLIPKLRLPGAGESVHSDPPILALYAAPLAPFILWGFVLSLRAARREPGQLLLLGWPAATIAPLLLTTRVDAHRMTIASIPITLWAVAGVLAAADLLARRDFLRRLRVPLATVLLGATGFFALRPVIVPGAAPSPLARVLVEAVRGDRPVVLAVLGDHADVGWAQLKLLDRLRSRPPFPALVLEERLIRGLGGTTEPPRKNVLREVEDLLLDEADLVLAPESELAAAGHAFSAEGFPARRIRVGEMSALRLTKPGRVPAAPAGPGVAFAPLETVPHVFLSSLEPTIIDCPFAKPGMDTAWDGSPISLGGVVFAKGVGMHAPCEVSWAVPEGAASFQAVVGLQPSARACPDAAVRFELLDEKQGRIYRSPIVDLTSPRILVAVPVAGMRILTLVASEGGNGRDCDHASWADAAFVLGPD